MARERHASESVRPTPLPPASWQQPALDLLAEDLRQAQLHLNEITGTFSSDDLLGEIFPGFALGNARTWGDGR
jgi:tRNA modification GTPase